MAIKKRQTISDMIDEYFQDMDRWVEQVRETLSERPSWDLKTSTMEPLREVTVKPTEVIVTVDLPFAKEETIHVEAPDSSSLEILAEMKKKIRLKELGVMHREGVIQRFHAWISLPVPVKMKKMMVEHKKGILEIRLPRKRSTQSKRKE